MKILIVDDDKDIVELLSIYVKNEGYEVERAYNGKEAITKLNTNPDIGLMILDIMMPQMDGLAVVREVRKDSQIPVLMLSAKTDDLDKIQGLIQGADDYVTKPFGMGELIARIRAALRHRVQDEGAAPVFRSGDLVVDLVRRFVTIGGEEVKLSPKEYDILRLLVIHAGKVLTHRMIMHDVWGAAGDVQYLRIYIRQLRQKLERNPERPAHIVTETGVGYRLRLPE